MGKFYIKDRELYYQIVLSKGKGTLTKEAKDMLVLIAEGVIKTKLHRYKNKDDSYDCLHQSIIHLLTSWKSFNENKYEFAFPFFTEIAKRGLADGFNIIRNKKPYDDNNYRFISMDAMNEGKGCHLF